MAKYSHPFRFVRRERLSFFYASPGWDARLDFLESGLLRVAVIPQGIRLLPSWSVQPGAPTPREGRSRLSMEGFSPAWAVPEDTRERTAFPLVFPSRPFPGASRSQPAPAPSTSPEAGFAKEPSALSARDAFHFDWTDSTGASFSLSVSPENFLLRLARNGGVLLADRPPLAMNLEGEFGPGQKHYSLREPGEQIFGLGDKSGNVDKAGRRFRLDCCDAMGYDARSSDPLYKHVPFYLCRNSAGTVGMFYDTHAECAFDFGAEISNYTGPYRSVSMGEKALVYYILLGELKQIVAAFSRLTGGMATPPRRTLYYAGSTMAYTDAPDAQAQLTSFARECVRRNFTCGGFYLSSGYGSIGAQRFVFHWNREKIPRPKALCGFFHRRGMDVIANVKPVFLTNHPLYPKIREQGWFLTYPDGSPALTPFWDGMGSFLDFTNPGAYDFWKEQVKEALLSQGVDYTWNDNNEYEIADQSVMANGFGHPVPAKRLRPVFSMLMTMASLEAQKEFYGEEKPQFTSIRAGCAGLNRLGGSWSGDNRSCWSTLRYNHYMGMTLSLSGIFNYGHDIGGFAGDAPGRELFLRWLQHGVLTPRFVIHSWNSDGRATTPWFYEDAVPAVQRIFAFRQRILPYLWSAFWEAAIERRPITRPLFYEFPQADPESDLFLLSDGLLAACVFDEGVSRLSVSLPGECGWYDDDGTWYPGGSVLLADCPLDGPPKVFHRAGRVFMEDAAPYGRDGKEKLLLSVFASEEGVSRGTLYLSHPADQTRCVSAEYALSFNPRDVALELSLPPEGLPAFEVKLVDCLCRGFRFQTVPAQAPRS